MITVTLNMVWLLVSDVLMRIYLAVRGSEQENSRLDLRKDNNFCILPLKNK